MKAAVITFPGLNREKDIIDVLRKNGDSVEQVFHKESQLPNNLDAIFLPGGFSYGDYLRAGAIAALSPIMNEVKAAADKGIKIIGICNGFQILCEAKLLQGALTRNQNLQFICDHIYLRVENNARSISQAYEKHAVIKVPIAHMDGNYYADEETMKKLHDNNQIIFRYCDEAGNINSSCNPNGSLSNIAGICNEKGNVFGLMPHPENAVFAHQESQDGAKIFQALRAVL